MIDLDPSSHIFRHIKKSWMDGDFVEPAAGPRLMSRGRRANLVHDFVRASSFNGATTDESWKT